MEALRAADPVEALREADPVEALREADPMETPREVDPSAPFRASRTARCVSSPARCPSPTRANV
jgi:hypothetical protein